VTGPAALSDEDAQTLDQYWRAANYLAACQIYLMDNPLLTQPLRPEHIKPRLLGHWGTSPGLNFIWAHLNRAILTHDADMMIVIGPGHGGPAALANTWLEGSYSDIYPSVPLDTAGMQTLFRQFAFPGGVPSHVAPETPGSIHEGGELGYSMSHAHGAAFDNPGLIVACVIGDGEAETGPLATSWHSHRFLDPAADGAVLPILHLNGWKIANPTVLARLPEPELDALLRGYGYEPAYVTSPGHPVPHLEMAAALDAAIGRIRTIQDGARQGGRAPGQRWPMIVLRTPKGWTGPAEVDGLPVEGTWRAHQVPLAEVRTNPAHLRQLEGWLKSYRAPSCSRPGARRGPRSCASCRPARAGSARLRTRTAACCCVTWTCRTSATTRFRSPPPAAARPRRRGCSAPCCATSCGATRRSATSASSDRTRPSPTG
jgi:xylulose-5-phosphate/fructose-6-phosphate phosphoketolase